MKKTEYLAQLEKYLKKLPHEDYLEAMEYFNEYFDEAGPEAEEAVIAELGTPKEAAHELITNLLDKQFDHQVETPKRSPKEIISLIVLAILAAPVAFPLAISILAISFAFIIAILAVLFALLMTGLGFIITSGVTFYETLTNLSGASSSLAFGIGISLGLLGGGILLTLITITLGKWTGRLTVKGLRAAFKGGK